jgi:hypothetical protein
MSATIAPVTMGGSSASMNAKPRRSTTKPTMKNAAPTAAIPHSAAGIPPPDFAASTGAMNAKLAPR